MSNDVDIEGDDGTILVKKAPTVYINDISQLGDESDSGEPEHGQADDVEDDFGDESEDSPQRDNESVSPNAPPSYIAIDDDDDVNHHDQSRPDVTDAAPKQQEETANVKVEAEVDADGEPVYCICRQGEKGKMIQCDECNEWYHYRCLKLPQSFKIGPQETFLCDPCRHKLGKPTFREENGSLFPQQDDPSHPTHASSSGSFAKIKASSKRRTPHSPPGSSPSTGATRASKRLRSNDASVNHEKKTTMVLRSADASSTHHIPPTHEPGLISPKSAKNQSHKKTREGTAQSLSSSSSSSSSTPPSPSSSTLTTTTANTLDNIPSRRSRKKSSTLSLTDKARSRLRTGFEEALREGANSEEHKQSAEEIAELAAKIESVLFQQFPLVDVEYQSKARTLLFNLKNKKNPELCQRVLRHELFPEQLVQMDAASLASTELQKLRQTHEEESTQQHVLSELDADHPLLFSKCETIAAPQGVAGSGSTTVQESFVPVFVENLTTSDDQQLYDELGNEQYVHHETHLSSSSPSLLSSSTSSLSSSSSTSSSSLISIENENQQGGGLRDSTGALIEKSIPAFNIPSFDAFSSLETSGGGFSPRTPPGTPPPFAYPALGLPDPSEYSQENEPVWHGEIGKDVIRKFSVYGTTLIDVQHGQKPFAELLPRTLHTKGRMERATFLAYLNDLERSSSTKRAALLLHPSTEEDKDCYGELFAYYRTKNRTLVVSGGANRQIREMFVLPLSSDDELPPCLVAEMENIPNRGDVLVCILVLFDVHRVKTKPPKRSPPRSVMRDVVDSIPEGDFNVPEPYHDEYPEPHYPLGENPPSYIGLGQFDPNAGITAHTDPNPVTATGISSEVSSFLDSLAAGGLLSSLTATPVAAPPPPHGVPSSTTPTPVSTPGSTPAHHAAFMAPQSLATMMHTPHMSMTPTANPYGLPTTQHSYAPQSYPATSIAAPIQTPLQHNPIPTPYQHQPHLQPTSLTQRVAPSTYAPPVVDQMAYQPHPQTRGTYHMRGANTTAYQPPTTTPTPRGTYVPRGAPRARYSQAHHLSQGTTGGRGAMMSHSQMYPPQHQHQHQPQTDLRGGMMAPHPIHQTHQQQQQQPPDLTLGLGGYRGMATTPQAYQLHQPNQVISTTPNSFLGFPSIEGSGIHPSRLAMLTRGAR